MVKLKMFNFIYGEWITDNLLKLRKIITNFAF